jgi:hypothetical protein
MLNRRVLGVVVLVCTFSSLALADQPYMNAARTNLLQARGQLHLARGNKDGHRVNAIAHVNKAIGLVNQGIEFDRRNNHAVSALSEVFDAAVMPDQPHMRSALELLRSARTNLENATSDKGGYRKKAIDEVNEAIDETKKGIDAGE